MKSSEPYILGEKKKKKKAGRKEGPELNADKLPHLWVE